MKTVENFELYLELGHGQFGKVFLCRVKAGKKASNTLRPPRAGRAVACKMITTNHKSFHPKMMRYLQTEIDLMMNIKNEYVLALVDAKKT